MNPLRTLLAALPAWLDCEQRDVIALREENRAKKAEYHAERNHQGIGNELVQPLTRPHHQGVVRRQRMSGMLNFYYRTAA